ncbi:MAG: type II toxin-antitoxin system VapC family toxin [Alphaproteobacteria bacterium]|nr:type II toxin-antitoxin system VapC family toxin [Alphaproteobacteria bacterium]
MSWVIDASVAVLWFVPSPLSPTALALLDDGAPLMAPDLIVVEVANVLWKRERYAGTDALDIAGAVAVLTGGALRLRLAAGQLPVAIDMARRVGRSVAECLYVALAVDEDATLVTADRRLVDRLRPTLYGRRVRLLDDLATGEGPGGRP